MCHPPYISLFEMERGAPEIRTKAPPTALVSMTQIPPPTASSCVYSECVCSQACALPVCEAVSCARMCAHACTGMSPHVYMPELGSSAYLSPSLSSQNMMTNRVKGKHNVNSQHASYVQKHCARPFTCSIFGNFIKWACGVSTVIIPILPMRKLGLR